MFEMKTEYLTGIDQIDQEHARLFEIAERAYELLNNDFAYDKYDDIIAIIMELKEYTKYHFQHEEEYMESIGYKKMFTQKIQHQQFIEKLDEYDFSEIDENQTKNIEDILMFLGNWLVQHILHCDKDIATQA